MYTTCLFCNGDLGHNEVVENFPVGRRLAFDAGKGRLWVVCRRCERWNLTPLEERWEAIEECERAFRGTKLRVSTDEIGLARLREGLELVRIGAPQRPEMAAWRYGDQFGRRRRRHIALAAGAVAVGGVAAVAGPMLGLVGLGALNPAMNLVNAVHGLYRARKFIAVPGPDGTLLRTRLSDVPRVKLRVQGDEVALLVPTPIEPSRRAPWWRLQPDREMHVLTGAAAIRAAGAILPSVNQSGGNAHAVQRAVTLLEDSSSTSELFIRAADAIGNHGAWTRMELREKHLLRNMPVAARLALEMAAHEETERRALEGELHILEAAWRDAEEIAHIADDMFLPPTIDTDLQRLKDGVKPRRSDEADQP
jgi:hypothetical protein